MKLYLLLPFLLFGYFYRSPLPDFKFKTADGKVIDQSSLVKGKPVMIFYYNPTYQISADQAELMYYANEDFKDINTLWISAGDHGENTDFDEEFFGEYDWPLNIVCADENDNFGDYWDDDIYHVLTIMVYDKDWIFAGQFFNPQTTTKLLSRLK